MSYDEAVQHCRETKDLDKYNKSLNISDTCRWVRAEFNRSTFDRKSLRKMVSREQIFRKAAGTRRIRKTVRSGTGYFHRMDKELAAQVRKTRTTGIPV